MKANITRHGFGLTILMFVVFFVLFIWHAPAVGPDTESAGLLPLERFINIFSTAYPVLATVVLGVVIFSGAVMLAVLASRNMIHSEKTYLPITMYLFVGGGMLCSVDYLNVFISSFLVVCSACIMFGSFSNIGSMSGVFNAAVLLGIAPLFYPPSAVFILSLPVAMTILRTGGRMWIVALCGVLIPVALYSYVGWVLGDGFFVLLKDIAADVVIPVGFADDLPVPYMVLMGIIGIMFFWAIVVCVRTRHTMRTRAMKGVVYSFWMLLLALLMFALPSRSLADMAFVAIPAAVLFPGIFIRTGRVTASNILYLLLVVAVIVVNVY